MIRENLAKVLERIDKACQRAGRKREEVRIVAVTKTVAVREILEAARCGIREIAESRVQESEGKFQQVQSSIPLRWHMAGHLQTNKVARAVEIFDMIQSLDSLKLARAVDRRASQIKKIQDCLAELKVSEEKTKTGLLEEEMESFLSACRPLKNLRLRGLMALAPFLENAENARPYFARAREIFLRFFVRNREFGVENPVLSMGMSGDFEAAIEEGSGMVRIGRAIFGQRTVPGARG
jgi:pyridoxal phosphate enzyme (YggS family)